MNAINNTSFTAKYYSFKFSSFFMITVLLLCSFALSSSMSKKAKLRSSSLNRAKQIYTKVEVSPIKIFLDLIANNNNTVFCIKRVIGKPQPYKTYKCPVNMKIHDDVPNTCIKDCPKNFFRGKEYCEEICEAGYTRENELCVDKINKKNYKPNYIPLIKSDPICINGYFSNGLCYSCFGNSEHSNGKCVSQCFSGAPSDNFCAFNDEANRLLSLINDDWASFFRSLFVDLLKINKEPNIAKNNYDPKKINNLKDVENVILRNESDKEIQILSGKNMIFLRDKFLINLGDDGVDYLRNTYLKMLSRFPNKHNKTKDDILSVVDDLIYFKGDYTSPYLDQKNYDLESLSATAANILDYVCE